MKLPVLKKLANGLRVYFLPQEEAESITIYLKGLAGSNYERIEEAGTAHLLEHWMLKGSKNYPNESDLLNLVTFGGGKYIGVTSRDDVLFGIHVLKDYFEDALKFLSEIFCFPKLDDENFAIVQNLAKNEIKRYFDMPEKLIARLAYATVFPNTRLAIFNTGNLDSVTNLDPITVKNFYKNNYVNDKFILVINGKFDIESASEILADLFTTRKLENPGVAPTIPLPKNSSIMIYDTYKFLQDYIRIDYLAPAISDEHKYAAIILAKYLDILLKNQLQNQGISYKVSVDCMCARNYGLISFFAACTHIDLDKLLLNFTDILKSSIKSVDNTLLERAKHIVVSNIIFALEKPSMRTEYYSEILLHGSSNQNHLSEIEKIKQVKAVQFRAVAKKILVNPQVTLISNKSDQHYVDDILTHLNI